LQGEANTAGLPTVFIRLTGCPLRCTYCDTTYSFEGGERQSLDQIIETALSFKTPYICVTGGEPLAQPNCLHLLTRLSDLGCQVSLETSGALDVSKVDSRVSKVLDLKTPTSGEEKRNLLSNLDYLTPHDQIKFVICNREDYEWSKQQLENYQLDEKVSTVWFSPAFAVEKASVKLPQLARDMAQWILDDHLPVRFNCNCINCSGMMKQVVNPVYFVSYFWRISYAPSCHCFIIRRLRLDDLPSLGTSAL
jgi:7-carboxy-7-deazaguanine synthase